MRKIKKYSNHTAKIEFALIALLIFLPLFNGGYILLLDYVIAPYIKAPTSIENTLILGYLFHWSNLVIPSHLIQKLLLFFILYLSGISMYKLVDSESSWPKYFAGILYIFNPFVYARFLAGHHLFLIGYALLPFFIKSLLEFYKAPNFNKTIRLGLWIAAISSISIHSIFFMVLILLTFSLAFILENIKNKKLILKGLKFSVLTGLMVIVLNSYWLIPYVSGQTETAQVAAGFDSKHVEGFQTLPDEKWGILFNTAAMYGFWAEGTGDFIVQKDILPYWPYLFMAILGLAVWGAMSTFKIKKSNFSRHSRANGNPGSLENQRNICIPFSSGNDRKNEERGLSQRAIVLGLIIIGIISFIFAVGVSHPLTAKVYWFAYEHIPFFKGYREPHKFVGLLVLVYAYLGALGVNNILEKLGLCSHTTLEVKTQKNSEVKKNKLWIPFPRSESRTSFKGMIKKLKVGLPLIFISLPIIYSPLLLWGAGGQIKPVDYPKDWYQTNEFLKQDEQNFNVLFLPWHQYIGFNFTGRVVANPAEKFFDKPIIQGDNMEFGAIYSQTNNPTSKYIEENLVLNKGPVIELGQKLKKLDIKYIILAKEADWENYKFLNIQKDLKRIKESENLIIYKNTAYKDGENN